MMFISYRLSTMVYGNSTDSSVGMDYGPWSIDH
ncbi:hypothetical protein HDF22_004478 [Mucilaginibacter lappiensis]|uniref:Uncharacterized protein n=1 Tax=Mucilaginibacter lappiensis TaxID=354630 RepID=A0A841JNM3_9SPHI|nr:hypothetical protein [Mucilaginibacter lappiensis]